MTYRDGISPIFQPILYRSIPLSPQERAIRKGCSFCVCDPGSHVLSVASLYDLFVYAIRVLTFFQSLRFMKAPLRVERESLSLR